MVVKVAINGYGTIGKRVADAIDAQDDMEIVGVTKTRLRLVAILQFAKAIRCTAHTMHKKKCGLCPAGYVAKVVFQTFFRSLILLLTVRLARLAHK